MSKKYISIVFVVFLCFFSFLNNIYALNCAEVQQEINNYNVINEELSKLDCSVDDNAEIVNSCNKLRLEKNTSLNKLYHSDVDAKSCPKVQKEVSSILKENENNCGKVFNDTIDKIISYVMGIFYIVGPILLILFGVLDFSHATVSSDKDALKKASIKFSKRLLATLLLFLSPLITRLILSLNTSDYNLSGDAYVCNYSNTILKKNYTITYVPKASNTNNNFSLNEEYFNWKQGDSKWKSILLGVGSDTSLGSIGCTTTAIAIQIASSGVANGSFNPGVLANTIKSGGGYSSGGGMFWDAASNAWQSVAPGFKHSASVKLTGDISSKASQLSNYINQGYYPVVEVKCSNSSGYNCNQHWVAAIAVQGNNIIFADPGSSSNDVINNSKYNFAKANIPKRAELYRVE